MPLTGNHVDSDGFCIVAHAGVSRRLPLSVSVQPKQNSCRSYSTLSWVPGMRDSRSQGGL
ncbi:MAG: hypothetical protein ACRDNS_08855 [Trebonia sp.]